MREIVKFIMSNWAVVLPVTVLVLVLPFVVSKYFPNNPAISNIKQVFKVVFTNRINVLVIFVSVYLFGFFSAIINEQFSIGEAIFGTTYGIVLYGMMFWTGFIMCILVLDIVLFSFYTEPKYTTYKLAIEWVLISSPFIYWVVRYNQWIFLVAVLAFLAGQYLRRPYIIRILE